MSDITQDNGEPRAEATDRSVTTAIIGVVCTLIIAFTLAPNLFLAGLSQ